MFVFDFQLPLIISLIILLIIAAVGQGQEVNNWKHFKGIVSSLLVLVDRFEILLRQYTEESASRIGDKHIQQFAQFKYRFDCCAVKLQELLKTQPTFFMFEHHVQGRLKALETRVDQLEEGTKRSATNKEESLCEE